MAQQFKPQSGLGMSKLVDYKGYLFSGLTTPSWIEEVQSSFVCQENDIFIASMYKSGTHWLTHIVELIKSQMKLSTHISDRIVYLDYPQFDKLPKDMSIYGEDALYIPTKTDVANLPSPRIFFSHFPWEFLPYNQSAKYIYLHRNPKDVAVSAYSYFTGIKSRTFEGSFEEFFNYYIHTDFLGYMSHVKGYFNHENLHNLYILSYEELQRDFKLKVEEISTFLGFQMSPDIFQLIATETNFETMQNNEFINSQNLMQDGCRFLRKGKVGSWKDTLTSDQSQKIDKILSVRLGRPFIEKNIIFEI